MANDETPYGAFGGLSAQMASIPAVRRTTYHRYNRLLIAPVFVLLVLANLLIYWIFAVAWEAIKIGLDLSFLHLVVVSAAKVNDYFVACGYPHLGSFYSDLVLVDIIVVAASGVFFVRLVDTFLPVFKAVEKKSMSAWRRDFISSFTCILLIGVMMAGPAIKGGCPDSAEITIGRAWLMAVVTAWLSVALGSLSRNARNYF